MASYHAIQRSLARCQANYDAMEPDDGLEDETGDDDRTSDDDFDRGDPVAEFGGVDV